MVSPVGFGRSTPLQQAAGAAGAGAAPAAPKSTTVSEALKFVADLWVPIKATDMEGRRSLRAEDARLQHWYYPELGKELAALFTNPRARALRKLSQAQTASQLLIAITNASNNGYDITGNEIKQAAVKLDPGFLKQSVKICLDNIINSTNYRQGVDADHYENQLYRILTSPSRSGASRASVTPAVIAALKSMHSGTTADAAADALLKDGRFKLTGVASAAGAGAAPAGTVEGYPSKAMDLARQIVKMKAKQNSEVLTDAQVEERAKALLTSDYKNYEGYDSALIDKMEEDLAAASTNTGKPSFNLNIEDKYFSSKEPYSALSLSAEMNPEKPLTFWSSSDKHTSIILKKAEFSYSKGKKEKKGLYPGEAYVGDLWMMKSNDDASGAAQLALKHSTTGGHKFAVGGGYSGSLDAGALGFLGSYTTPSFMAKDDLRLSADVFFATETHGVGGWTPQFNVRATYEKAEASPKPEYVDVQEAKVEAAFISKSDEVSSKITAAVALNLGSRMTLAAQYRRIVLGDTYQDFATTFKIKMNNVFALRFEGVASSSEKAVSYGSPNSGVSLDGTVLPQQPSSLNSTSTLSAIAAVDAKVFDWLKVYVGGGTTNYNAAVEDLGRSEWAGVILGGANIALPRFE